MIYKSAELLAGLKSQYPEVRSRGFPKAIRALMPADDDPHEWATPDFVPDAYSILIDEREIHLFEIEITHPLSTKKAGSIGRFAAEMDADGWAVGVHIVNRYGHLTVLNWFDLYTKFLWQQLTAAAREGHA